MSRENLLSIESTVASQRLNAAAELYVEDGESNAFFAIRGKGDWDPLPWVLILFVKSLDGYLICTAGDPGFDPLKVGAHPLRARY